MSTNTKRYQMSDCVKSGDGVGSQKIGIDARLVNTMGVRALTRSLMYSMKDDKNPQYISLGEIKRMFLNCLWDEAQHRSVCLEEE